MPKFEIYYKDKIIDTLKRNYKDDDWALIEAKLDLKVVKK